MTLTAAAPSAAADMPSGRPGMHGMHGMHERMEGMKQHMDEMKKAVADLRESEKKLESAADSKEFRDAVTAHLKMIDDLHASHVGHMESMMERMHHGKGAMMQGMGSAAGGCPCGCCGCCAEGCR